MLEDSDMFEPPQHTVPRVASWLPQVCLGEGVIHMKTPQCMHVHKKKVENCYL